MTDKRVIEVMLLRWGENHASGKTVTFQLPEDEGTHPFRGLPCGPTNGQRLALSVALINDDETTKEPAPEPKPTERKTTNAQLAGILCNDEWFWKYIHKTSFIGVADEKAAAKWLRGQCGVESRTELDENKAAGIRFHQVKAKFEAWRAGDG